MNITLNWKKKFMVYLSIILYVCLNRKGNVIVMVSFVNMASFLFRWRHQPCRYSPIGITFLIAGKIVGMEDFGVLMTRVGLYFLTVLFGLTIHGGVLLPLLYFVITRRNPYVFLRGILEAMATAFGTSSRYLDFDWSLES